jgi:diacylglycerol kinase (ATP)
MRDFLHSRFRSFRFALRGIGEMLATETNARIHALATIVVILAGFFFEIDRGEWLAVTLAIAAVWSAEAFNTAFESICDVASKEFHPKIERAKDIAAGAVLAASIGAVVVAVLVFGDPLIALVRD